MKDLDKDKNRKNITRAEFFKIILKKVINRAKLHFIVNFVKQY